MNIKIDTERWEITINQPVLLDELIHFLKKYDSATWKRFSIVPEMSYIQTYPIYPQAFPSEPYTVLWGGGNESSSSSLNISQSENPCADDLEGLKDKTPEKLQNES